MKPTCHPERKLYARGRCNSCYRGWRLTQKTERATCHPDRAHVAKGKCRNCYKALCDKRLPKERMSQRWRKAALKHSFGITVEQFDDLLAAQGGRCAMCGSETSTGRYKTLAVDHDHATGRVRGLLCFRCNTGLGYYEKFGAVYAAYLDRTKAA